MQGIEVDLFRFLILRKEDEVLLKTSLHVFLRSADVCQCINNLICGESVQIINKCPTTGALSHARTLFNASLIPTSSLNDNNNNDNNCRGHERSVECVAVSPNK